MAASLVVGLLAFVPLAFWPPAELLARQGLESHGASGLDGRLPRFSFYSADLAALLENRVAFPDGKLPRSIIQLAEGVDRALVVDAGDNRLLVVDRSGVAVPEGASVHRTKAMSKSVPKGMRE